VVRSGEKKEYCERDWKHGTLKSNRASKSGQSTVPSISFRKNTWSATIRLINKRQ